MLVILAWVEYLARSRMTRSGSLLTAVVLSGLLSVDTAPPTRDVGDRLHVYTISFLLTRRSIRYSDRPQISCLAAPV